MSEVLAASAAIVVVIGFVGLAVADARTSEVVVRQAQIVTLIAVGGLGSIALLSADWAVLATSAISAAVVTGIQLVPYAMQRRAGDERIGKADIRLGVPFGWTLGYFGLGFAFLGFAVALLAGLGAAAIMRTERLPFVPFLAGGLVVGLLWAALTAA